MASDVSQEGMVELWVPRLRSENSIFVKKTKMHAKLATEEGILETKIHGKVETRKMVSAGDYIIHGTEGERYALAAATFLSRYQHEAPEPATSEALAAEGFQLYKPTGRVWAHKVTDAEMTRDLPTGKFIASWGEAMIVAGGDYLATPYPSAGEVYRIDSDAFDHTYVKE